MLRCMIYSTFLFKYFPNKVFVPIIRILFKVVFHKKVIAFLFILRTLDTFVLPAEDYDIFNLSALNN